MSTERLIVDDTIADAFVAKLAEGRRICRRAIRAVMSYWDRWSSLPAERMDAH